MGAGGGASGSWLASSIAGGWPRQVGHRLAIQYGAPVAHRQRARGSTVDTWSASAPGCLVPSCTFFLREGELGSCGRLCLAPWSAGLRITLMEKCAPSTLQLPSELVVARGNWTLRS